MNFKKDLTLGEKYQVELINVLKPINYKMMTGLFKEYDLIIDDIMPIYYEVKADRYTYKTGNFCIEYECSNKKSGISTTTADYYAYFILKPIGQYDLYIIPVIDIKNLINKDINIKKKTGGDNNNSKFYLININIFNQYKMKL
jgi:hypothetical protein